jgi:hypothetical protein
MFNECFLSPTMLGIPKYTYANYVTRQFAYNNPAWSKSKRDAITQRPKITCFF